MDWFWSLEKFYKVALQFFWELILDYPDGAIAIIVALVVILGGETTSRMGKGGDSNAR